MEDAEFKVQGDYEVPLLRLMAALPGGQGRTDAVCRLFEAEYGQRIPPEHFETMIGKEAKWRNNVRWCRKYLIERGFFDAPAQGIWRITEEGRRWLEEHPGEARIPGSASSLVRKRRPVPIPRARKTNETQVAASAKSLDPAGDKLPEKQEQVQPEERITTENLLAPFKVQADYEVPLLNLLADLPTGQGRVADIYYLFEERYGTLIPDKDRGLRSNGGAIWKHNVRWCRERLKNKGFLDAPGHGVWRVTESGKHWLRNNSGVTRIEVQTSRRPREPKKVPSHTSTIARKTKESSESLRMGEAASSSSGARSMLDRQQKDIRAFLQGRASRPSDEVLCDWVQFCYTIEAFEEGYELFNLVVPGAVNDWLYGRTKKLAQVCRIRAQSKE